MEVSDAPPLKKHIPEDDEYSYEKSRAKQTHFKALTEELNYNALARKIVTVDKVTGYIDAVGTKLGTRLQQLADRLAPRLAHESDEMTIHSLINKELNDVSSEVESMFDPDEALSNIMETKPQETYERKLKVVKDLK